ncbi:hypothetical protein KY320_00320 [Candidatus Woesearchaeota archaeon]|nr:hypothetical protein [Candidatus Woesearchaeota archaeon]
MIEVRVKCILWIAVFVLTLSAVFAQGEGITIHTRAIKNAISGGDEAMFNVTITNNMRYDDFFNLRFSDDVQWTILTDPLKYKFSQFELKVGESVNFIVKVRASPAAMVAYNQYMIGLKVEGEATKTSSQVLLVIGYGPQFLSPKEYATLVVASAEVPEEVDPRKPMEILVNVRNKNPLNISGLKVTAKSNLIDEVTEVPLGPLEQKQIVFEHNFDALQPPGTDLITIKVSREDVDLITIQKSYSILAYSQFEERKEVEKSFMKSTTTLYFTNNGNYRKEEQVFFEISGLRKLFASADPEANFVRRDNKQYLSWYLSLNADETKEIVVVESMLPLVYLACLLLVVYVFYLLLRNPVTLKKDAVIIAKREGGIAGLKIVVTVHNRGKRKLGDVWMVDSLPNIADVDKKAELGTLEPKRIVKHEKRGTLVKWHIGDLEAGEERIIRYEAKARLTIIGSFTLPAAIARFKKGNKEKLSYSNRLKLSV